MHVFLKISLIAYMVLPVAEAKPAPRYQTLSMDVAQKRFAGDPAATPLLRAIEGFSNVAALRLADPVLIVEETPRDPVAVLSGDTVYLTPVRVMSIALAAQSGPVVVEETPLYITHAEIDQALITLAQNRLSDLPAELILLRHIAAGITPNSYLSTDLVVVEAIASCAQEAGPLAAFIIRNAYSPDDADHALTPTNPEFTRTLPECLKIRA